MPANIAEAVPRLKRLIPRLRGKRIGVLGDLMLDRYLWGTASRLSPEAAVPVVDFVEQSECLGGAGNVARAAQTLALLYEIDNRHRCFRRKPRSRSPEITVQHEVAEDPDAFPAKAWDQSF